MPKKIQNFARSALVQPITVNVGRAGAASLDVVQEVEYVKQEAKIVYILECLQKTAPPVSLQLFFFYLCIITNTSQTRNVCETCMPLSLIVTLIFDLETPNSIGVIY